MLLRSQNRMFWTKYSHTVIDSFTNTIVITGYKIYFEVSQCNMRTKAKHSQWKSCHDVCEVSDDRLFLSWCPPNFGLSPVAGLHSTDLIDFLESSDQCEIPALFRSSTSSSFLDVFLDPLSMFFSCSHGHTRCVSLLCCACHISFSFEFFFRVRNVITPFARCESCRQSPVVFSLRLLCTFCCIFMRWRKSADTPEALTRTDTAPLENVRRISGVQCITKGSIGGCTSHEYSQMICSCARWIRFLCR